jgi:hypothetical protein
MPHRLDSFLVPNLIRLCYSVHLYHPVVVVVVAAVAAAVVVVVVVVIVVH